MSACTAVLSQQQRAQVVALAPDRAGTAGEPGGAGDPAGGTSVHKALAVLEAFTGPGAILGVTEVARRGGLSKSTAHRMLTLLVEHGYVERDGSRYALGPKLFELGNAASSRTSRSLRAIAMPYMVDLVHATRATVHLTVPVGSDLLLLDKVYGHQCPRGGPSVGARMPAGGSAPGDAIRAFSPAGAAADEAPLSPQEAHRMAKIRLRGFAEQDVALGRPTICLAAPVLARSTRTAVAALSVVLRKDQRRPPHLGGDLRAFAARIGEGL